MISMKWLMLRGPSQCRYKGHLSCALTGFEQWPISHADMKICPRCTSLNQRSEVPTLIPAPPQSTGDLLTCKLLIRTMEECRWLSKHIESILLLQPLRHLMWYLLLSLPAVCVALKHVKTRLILLSQQRMKNQHHKIKQSGSQLLGAARLFAQTMLWKHLWSGLKHPKSTSVSILNTMHCKLNKQL